MIRLINFVSDRNLEDLYYSRSPAPSRPPMPAPSYANRASQNPFSSSVDNPFVDLSFTLPARGPSSSYTGSWEAQPPPPRRTSSIFGPNPFNGATPRSSAPPRPPASEQTPRRNHISSTTAARSLEGDDRPIFGGAGSGGGRGQVRPTNPSIQEEPSPPGGGLQRRGTFVLEEPSLPNLPQSGAQRPRDTVNVQELYNVRARDRAQTPVTFTINLNEAPPPSTNQAS